jgi:two-component system, sensor histidine kinase ChiS
LIYDIKTDKYANGYNKFSNFPFKLENTLKCAGWMRSTSGFSFRDHMMDNMRVISFLFPFLLFACSPAHDPKTEESFRPGAVTSDRYIVPGDSFGGPDISLAGKPYQVRVKRKTEFATNLNIKLAGAPVILNISAPVVNTPGENGIEFPKSVKIIDIPVLCKTPEVITVKDAKNSDINPQNFISYSRLQGLRHDQIRSMIQDRRGNLWMATDDGLTRYDGKYFSHYTTDQGLNNNLILSVCQDKDENIWFGSFGGGVTKFDGKNLFHYTNSEGLAGNVVNCIFEDNEGNLWFGTTGGVTKYDGNFFTNYTTREGLCQNYIRSIIQDNSGRIWISTNTEGISVFNGKSFSNYSEKEGLIQNNVTLLFKDKNGHIWLGSGSNNLTKFDGVNFIHYPYYEGLSKDLVRSMVQDNEGNMWFGTETGGLIVFDGKYFTHYTDKEGLSSNLLRCSLKDKNGVLWFGTRGGGLNRYDGGLFTHLTKNEGLSNSRIMSILEDKPGNFWLATYGGYVTKCSFREINGIKQRYFTYYDQNDGLLSGLVYSIIKDKNGNIWFGTDGGGVSKFDGETMTTYTVKQGLCGDSVRRIIQDRSGNLWFATYGSGVSKFDGKYFYNYRKKQGLGSNNVLSILEDYDGNIWFGTEKGIARYDGDNFIQYNSTNGIIRNSVYSIMQDTEGIIWFGTAGSGLVSYDGKVFTECSDQLTNNTFILSILQDSRKNILLGTRSGLSVINRQILGFPQKYLRSTHFRSYSYEDGFTGIGCNIGALTEASDGTIWIGTNDRLTAYHPAGEKYDTITPILELTGLQLFNENIPWSELEGKSDSSIILHNGVRVGRFKFKDITRWSGLPENLSLKYNNNYLTFSYVAISVTKNSKIRYQYKLEGFEPNWNMLTAKTDASFGNLKPGKYIFKVKAVNSEGLWTNEVNYQFTIRPPWWETVWFYTFIIVTVIILIVSFIKYRLRRLKYDKELLQIRVDEQTFEITKKNLELLKLNAEKDKFFSIIAHDLRSPFSGFLGLTQKMAEDLPGLERDEIEKIAIGLRNSAANLYRLLENLLQWARMKQGLMSFNPEKLLFLPLVDEIVMMLIDQVRKKKIEIDYNIPGNITVFADKNMLQAIVRNLVSNAIKFTPAGGKITISAYRNPGKYFEISVRDSGIGMSQAILNNIFRIDVLVTRRGTEGEPSTGLGLLLCKEFVEKHHGTIRAESEEGRGSVFYFTLPVPSELL